ncbi:DNRLRE domain-containing protein, partial [bacterium]
MSRICSCNNILKTFVLSALFSSAVLAYSQVGVYTQRYDNARTGANLQETVLKTQNVNSAQFGRLFYRYADALIYSQPLIAPNVFAGGKMRNLLIFTTSSLSVYCYDADDPSATSPIWRIKYPTVTKPAGAGITFNPETMSTPVIDPATNTLYVVVKRIDGDINVDDNWNMYLHALDLATGQERPNSPVKIQAEAPGVGDQSFETRHTFKAKYARSRAGLLLLNGVVYITMASGSNDVRPYHGWVLGYDAATLQPAGVFSTTSNGSMGGIWMSGAGPAADADGNIYLTTGNGDVDYAQGNYGHSILKFSTANRQISLLDKFTASNWRLLNDYDWDLGTSGLTFVPGTNLLVNGSKQGRLYLLDRNNLGGLAPEDSQIPQVFQAAKAHIHGTPVFWNSPNGLMMYLWSELDYLKAFQFQNGRFITPNTYQSSYQAPFGMPSGMLAISANGETPGSGILWSNVHLTGEGRYGGLGVLRAWDASNLTELWNSHQKLEDEIGVFGHFGMPTVANGKVYLATGSNMVNVYGLRGNTVPQQPQQSAASALPIGAQVFWTPLPNTKSYVVERSESQTGPFVLVAKDITSNSYIDRTPEPGKTYYYRAYGINDVGRGISSVPTAGVTLPTVTTTPVTLGVTDDSYVRDGSYAGDNYGAATTLHVRAGTLGYTRKAFLKFDLTGLPDGYLMNAKLRLFGNHVGTDSSSVSIYAAGEEAWSQGGITWNNQPSIGAKLATTTVGPKLAPWEWDLSSYLYNRRSLGFKSVTLVVVQDAKTPDSGAENFTTRESTARESNSSALPRLIVQMVPFAAAQRLPAQSQESRDALAPSGAAAVDPLDGAIRLTRNVPNSAGSIFAKTPVNVTAFTTSFTFKLNAPFSGGLAFVLQNNKTTPAGLGGPGDRLGFGPDDKTGTPLRSAVALKFDTNPNSAGGGNATGLYSWASIPAEGGIDLTPSGIDLKSGHVFKADLEYD